jgi:hypothetical protein
MPRPSSLENQKEWEEKVLQQRQSGLSVQRWCEENKIRPTTFHYWKDKFASKANLSRSSFTELTDSKSTGITIECQGMHIHLDRHFDASTLKHCLQVLREVTC